MGVFGDAEAKKLIVDAWPTYVPTTRIPIIRVPGQAGHVEPREPRPMPRPISTVKLPQNNAPSPGGGPGWGLSAMQILLLLRNPQWVVIRDQISAQCPAWTPDRVRGYEIRAKTTPSGRFAATSPKGEAFY